MMPSQLFGERRDRLYPPLFKQRCTSTMTKLHTPTQDYLPQDVISEHVELASFASLDSRTDNDSHVVYESSEALNQPIGSEDDESTTQSPFHPNDTTITHSSSTQRKSAAQRMGRQTTLILVASLLLTLSVFAFLTFLWTAPHDHKLWRFIIVRGWAGTAVTVSSLLLRTAVDLQAGAAVAMLAAILLENNFRLLVTDTARVSKLRAGRAMPLDIVFPSMRTIRLEWRKGWSGCMRSVPTVTLVLPLVATTILLQLTSTILVSDLSLGVIPGKTSTEHPNIDLAYEWNETEKQWSYPFRGRAVSTWLQNPPAFPTFAEFSETIDVSEHVDDTGTLLRAFLPFQDAQSRGTISKYSGKAVVLDARVSCQRPLLPEVQVEVDNMHGTYRMAGSFGTTEPVAQLIETVDQVPFDCSLGILIGGESHSFGICQPSGFSYGGGQLLSVLRDTKQWSDVNENWNKHHDFSDLDYLANSAYLIFNTTWRDTTEVSSRTGTSTTLGNGAWTVVTYDYGDTFTHIDVSVSLCFPAAWTARLNVTLHSFQNRTEPVALSSDERFRTDPDVHVQMGEFEHYHA
jgi:fluoride ion exporter CrcB/FEX